MMKLLIVFQIDYLVERRSHPFRVKLGPSANDEKCLLCFKWSLDAFLLKGVLEHSFPWRQVFFFFEDHFHEPSQREDTLGVEEGEEN